MTYTYTARNLDNQDLVVTFTLENNHLNLGITELLEKFGKIAQSEERLAETKTQIKTQGQPGALKLAEHISGPIHISDVAAHLDGEKLKFIAWQRVAGLRLAPLRLNLGRVDNPDAAAAFVDELEDRQAAASYAGRFLGPLDYWAGWAGVLSALVFLIWWPLKRAKDRAN